MISAHEFRRHRAEDLLRLSTILLNNGLVKDSEPLNNAAAECRREPTSTTWGYEFIGLKFESILLDNNRQIRHTHPKKVTDVEIELHVCIKGLCVQVDNLCDPLNELVVELEIKGYSPDATEHFSAWHLDRQINNQIDHAAHPAYHFQYGGERVWNKPDNDYGLQLLLETPRFPHPPLDAILAVDFVLSNYFGDTWNELMKDDAYRELIATAQNIYWRPYSLSTTSHWQALSNQVNPHAWTPKLIWPSL